MQASSKGFNGMASPRNRSMLPRPRGLSNCLPKLAPGANRDLSSRSSSLGGLNKSPPENSKHLERESFRQLNHRRLATGSEPSVTGVQNSHGAIGREMDQEVPILSNTTTRTPHTTFQARLDSETQYTLVSPPAREVSDAGVSLSISPEATHGTSRKLYPQ